MAGDDGDAVGAVEGEVRVDEDEQVGYGLREGQRVVEKSPGVGVRVEDDGQEGGGRFWSEALERGLRRVGGRVSSGVTEVKGVIDVPVDNFS